MNTIQNQLHYHNYQIRDMIFWLQNYHRGIKHLYLVKNLILLFLFIHFKIKHYFTIVQRKIRNVITF